MFLTDEQKNILKNITGSMKINAAAGSGKTTTLVEFVKCDLESERIKGSEIAFITFTRFAADDIKKKIRKKLGKSTDILTGTFHSTIFKLMKMAGNKS